MSDHVDAILRFKACNCVWCGVFLHYGWNGNRGHVVKDWVYTWLEQNDRVKDLIIMYEVDDLSSDDILVRVRLRSAETAMLLKLAFVEPPVHE